MGQVLVKLVGMLKKHWPGSNVAKKLALDFRIEKRPTNYVVLIKLATYLKCFRHQ